MYIYIKICFILLNILTTFMWMNKLFPSRSFVTDALGTRYVLNYIFQKWHELQSSRLSIPMAHSPSHQQYNLWETLVKMVCSLWPSIELIYNGPMSALNFLF